MITPNVLIEMGRLQLSRPPSTATRMEEARWYYRKARMLRHLAAQGCTTAAADAEAAQAHARRLLTGMAGVA